jgi:hypothetical protein
MGEQTTKQPPARPPARFASSGQQVRCVVLPAKRGTPVLPESFRALVARLPQGGR